MVGRLSSKSPEGGSSRLYQYGDAVEPSSWKKKKRGTLPGDYKQGMPLIVPAMIWTCRKLLETMDGQRSMDLPLYNNLVSFSWTCLTCWCCPFCGYGLPEASGFDTEELRGEFGIWAEIRAIWCCMDEINVRVEHSIARPPFFNAWSIFVRCWQLIVECHITREGMIRWHTSNIFKSSMQGLQAFLSEILHDREVWLANADKNVTVYAKEAAKSLVKGWKV